MVRMRKEIISPLSATVDTSYQLFQKEGMSLVRDFVSDLYSSINNIQMKEQVAKRRSFHPSTIGGHIADALYSGYHVDYRRG